MNEYYGIPSTPTQDFLAHYGIRGMKWGVRKAIERGNIKKLSKQYVKAERKLARLSAKADIEVQKNNLRKHNRRALAAAGVGLAGLGAFTGNELIARGLAKKYGKASNLSNANGPIKNSVRKKIIVGEGKGIKKYGEGLGTGPVGNKAYTKYNKSPNAFRTIHDVSSAIGVAGLGAAAYQKARAIAAKRRLSAKGHAKAVAKRDAWIKEMNNTFNGKTYTVPYSKRKYRRK